MTQNQLQKPLTLSGHGIHSGQPCKLTISPGEVGSGYVFQRLDLEGQPDFSPSAKDVIATDRRTSLSNGTFTIDTTEHLLAALITSGILDAHVAMDASEVPILDGSAKPWIEAIEDAGLQAMGDMPMLKLPHAIRVEDETTGAWAEAVPSRQPSVQCTLSDNLACVGPLHAQWKWSSDASFISSIGQARTFTMSSQLIKLAERGLLQGANKDAGVVIIDKALNASSWSQLNDLFHVTCEHSEALGAHPLTPLRMDNEPSAHKLLDMIGDLALVGQPVSADIRTFRPGHHINTKLALKIMDTVKAFKNIPIYDITEAPLMDVTAIQNIIPHRPPFLLIDRIIKQSALEIVGIKAVTINESFFQGHFPGTPVMPGVLQLEAMAQVGGILALSTVPDPENYLTYFLKMDKVKFRNKVTPGDTLIFHLVFEGPVRRGIVVMHGKAYVGNKIACEGIFTAMITKDK
ncbi:MAG: bifunctional UDP-3-O-[3-hydroxymyristoyl] N-acetylglucosamine deacetylase/3-hydroxyacyl-ACP dehydratase [Flavobacteriales bacterium]